MSRDPYTFKLGQMTDKVWAGDIVTKCEFLGESEGRLAEFQRKERELADERRRLEQRARSCA